MEIKEETNPTSKPMETCEEAVAIVISSGEKSTVPSDGMSSQEERKDNHPITPMEPYVEDATLFDNQNGIEHKDDLHLWVLDPAKLHPDLSDAVGQHPGLLDAVRQPGMEQQKRILEINAEIKEFADKIIQLGDTAQKLYDRFHAIRDGAWLWYSEDEQNERNDINEQLDRIIKEQEIHLAKNNLLLKEQQEILYSLLANIIHGFSGSTAKTIKSTGNLPETETKLTLAHFRTVTDAKHWCVIYAVGELIFSGDIFPIQEHPPWQPTSRMVRRSLFATRTFRTSERNGRLVNEQQFVKKTGFIFYFERDVALASTEEYPKVFNNCAVPVVTIHVPLHKMANHILDKKIVKKGLGYEIEKFDFGNVEYQLAEFHECTFLPVNMVEPPLQISEWPFGWCSIL